jgi:hypothetical protein
VKDGNREGLREPCSSLLLRQRSIGIVSTFLVQVALCFSLFFLALRLVLVPYLSAAAAFPCTSPVQTQSIFILPLALLPNAPSLHSVSVITYPRVPSHTPIIRSWIPPPLSRLPALTRAPTLLSLLPNVTLRKTCTSCSTRTSFPLPILLTSRRITPCSCPLSSRFLPPKPPWSLWSSCPDPGASRL